MVIGLTSSTQQLEFTCNPPTFSPSFAGCYPPSTPLPSHKCHHCTITSVLMGDFGSHTLQALLIDPNIPFNKSVHSDLTLPKPHLCITSNYGHIPTLHTSHPLFVTLPPDMPAISFIPLTIHELCTPLSDPPASPATHTCDSDSLLHAPNFDATSLFSGWKYCEWQYSTTGCKH